MVSPTIVQVLSDLYPTSNRRLPACAVRADSHRARALAGGDTMIGVRASALPGTYLATARPRCVAASALPTRARFTTRSLIPAGTYPTIISATSQRACLTIQAHSLGRP